MCESAAFHLKKKKKKGAQRKKIKNNPGRLVEKKELPVKEEENQETVSKRMEVVSCVK